MDNDRIERLELITTRLMRRSTKRAVALITPYPISNAVFGENVRGTVLRYMFPCEGIISKGMIRLGAKPKKEVSFIIKVISGLGSASKGFLINRMTLAVEPNIPVSAGDCLDISLEALDEEIVTEVWISFLWKPTTKDVEVKSYLFEDIENDIQSKQLTAE